MLCAQCYFENGGGEILVSINTLLRINVASDKHRVKTHGKGEKIKEATGKPRSLYWTELY